MKKVSLMMVTLLAACGGGSSHNTTTNPLPAPVSTPTPGAIAGNGLYASPISQGTLAFQLHCNSKSSGVRDVAFGVPFPRGFLTDAIRSTQGLPHYRASPTRRVGWWYGTNESLSFFGIQK